MEQLGKRGRTGISLRGRFGAQSNGWRGGKPSIGRYGYREIYVGHDHPMANYKGRCVEQRLVMFNVLGRVLHGDEIVHHKNGDKLDNRVENLEVVDRRTHPNIHKHMRRGDVVCAGCGKTFFPIRKPRCRRQFCSRECFRAH